MDTNIPYMGSVKNLSAILDQIQKAGAPEVFNLDFLRDLGFKSSNDRGFIKVLRYLKMLSDTGRPQTAYREFMNSAEARKVLAKQLQVAYDELFLSNRTAHSESAKKLKGWFQTKTGESESVASKMATTFRSLASYADFESSSDTPDHMTEEGVVDGLENPEDVTAEASSPPRQVDVPLTMTYRLEINLPNTTNVKVFRSIFRALRDELLS